MRNSPILGALFPGVRQQILATTLLAPERSWFLSELAEHLGTSPSSLQREVESLAKSGILTRRQDGRRTYYQADTTSPVFGDLRSLFSKTAGIVPVLKAELERFADKIKWAAIYGSVARGEERGKSDIDLLIVGSVGMTELVPVLRRLEGRFGREVNVTRYSLGEFLTKRSGGNRFLNSVLKGKLISVIGSADELEETTSRRKGSRPQGKQKGSG
jgi:predicted nucleotidyltransferase